MYLVTPVPFRLCGVGFRTMFSCTHIYFDWIAYIVCASKCTEKSINMPYFGHAYWKTMPGKWWRLLKVNALIDCLSSNSLSANRKMINDIFNKRHENASKHHFYNENSLADEWGFNPTLAGRFLFFFFISFTRNTRDWVDGFWGTKHIYIINTICESSDTHTHRHTRTHTYIHTRVKAAHQNTMVEKNVNCAFDMFFRW